MFAILVVVLQQAYALVKEHPDLAEGLLVKAAGMLSGPEHHDNAAAQAGLAAGLSALASSAATTAMERNRRRSAENATLPLSADEVFGPESLRAHASPEDVAALVVLLNKMTGAELIRANV